MGNSDEATVLDPPRPRPTSVRIVVVTMPVASNSARRPAKICASSSSAGLPDADGRARALGTFAPARASAACLTGSTRPSCTVPQTRTSLISSGRWSAGCREDGEVGELAGHDAADVVLHLQRVGRVQRDGLQRAERLTRCSGPRTLPSLVTRLTRTTSGTAAGRRHRHVRVERVGDARFSTSPMRTIGSARCGSRPLTR